jgi:hypothetical protein
VPDRQRAIFQQRLDALSQDWSEGGAWFWLKRRLQQVSLLAA